MKATASVTGHGCPRPASRPYGGPANRLERGSSGRAEAGSGDAVWDGAVEQLGRARDAASVDPPESLTRPRWSIRNLPPAPQRYGHVVKFPKMSSSLVEAWLFTTEVRVNTSKEAIPPG